MLFDFVLFVCSVYIGLGALTFALLFIDYYRRLYPPRPTCLDMVGEVLELSSEWREVVFVVFCWPKVLIGAIVCWQENRAEEVRLRQLDAEREERRLEEQVRWREEASVRRKAAVPAAKPPRRVRKVVAQRQRRRS